MVCSDAALAQSQTGLTSGAFNIIFYSFIAVGFPAERFARLDVWHYHLEATEFPEEEEDAGLSYSNIMPLS